MDKITGLKEKIKMRIISEWHKCVLKIQLDE
jgi:hypothetical protein